MKDTKSLLLILLSIGLIGTWVYHLYDKSIYSQRHTEVFVKDSAAIADGVRDSLLKNYSETINDLGSRLDSTISRSDSTKNQLNAKLNEIYDLRNQISSILKNRYSNRGDLKVARKKISELQEKVSDLNNQNISIDEERKQLNATLDKVNGDVKTLEQNIKLLGDQNKDLTEKVKVASTFMTSELKFAAISTGGIKEQETKLVRKTDKFVISFNVQNNISDYKDATVYVVITQPNGDVLHNTVWDSGTFETHNGTKKDFTVKLKFDYVAGEQKQLLFSLEADINQKGKYTMQVWHNGFMIGQSEKTLK